jgi:integrase
MMPQGKAFDGRTLRVPVARSERFELPTLGIEIPRLAHNRSGPELTTATPWQRLSPCSKAFLPLLAVLVRNHWEPHITTRSVYPVFTPAAPRGFQMAKQLTAMAVLKLKPADKRLEIPDPGQSGLRLIIQPSGAKSWAVRFRGPNGKHGKLTLGPVDLSGKETSAEPVIGGPLTLAAARQLAAEVGRQRALGTDVVAERRTEKRDQRAAAAEQSSNTYPDAVRAYIDGHHAKNTDRKPRDWRESARMLGLSFPLKGGEPVVVKKGLCDRWRDKPLAEITDSDIFHVVEEARAKGIPGMGRRTEGVSKARGRKMAVVLKGMFQWLMDKRRIKTNPCSGLGRLSLPVARDRVLNVKADVRNADELRWLWGGCEKIGAPFGPICQILLLTGCRLKEIAHATTDEINSDTTMLRLPGARTKNGRPHDVPLSPLAREIIEVVPRLSNEFVFSTNCRSPVSGFSKYKKKLDKAMLALARAERGKDATVQPWRLHDLRRTASTGMSGIGVAPHVVEAILNHVSGFRGGVAGTYNHEQYNPEKKAALELWADHIAALVSK